MDAVREEGGKVYLRFSAKQNHHSVVVEEGGGVGSVKLGDKPAGDDTLAGLESRVGPHDIAFIKGPNGKVRQCAYEIDGWVAPLRVGDVMSMDDVPPGFGPVRQGIARVGTVYFLGPARNRVRHELHAPYIYQNFLQIVA